SREWRPGLSRRQFASSVLWFSGNVRPPHNSERNPICPWVFQRSLLVPGNLCSVDQRPADRLWSEPRVRENQNPLGGRYNLRHTSRSRSNSSLSLDPSSRRPLSRFPRSQASHQVPATV